MADIIYEWVGNAAPVAQVESYEILSTSLNDDFTLTINNKTVTAVALGAAQMEQVVEDLVAAWNAQPHPECRYAVASQELNGSAAPTVIKLTATVPGIPFAVVLSGDGGFATFAQVANSGPNVWGIADNYQNMSTGAYGLPEANDEVHVRVDRPAIRYGLTGHALAAIQLKNLRFDQAFRSGVGLPKRSGGGYNEYLPTSLYQKTAKLEVGRGQGGGASLLKVDVGTVLCEVVVENTGTSSTPDYAALQIDNLGTTSIVTVHRGEVDFFRESSGTGGMISFTQFRGKCRVLNGAGSLTMTSVSIYVHPGATLLWDAPLGGTAGDYYLHGGNITFGPNTVVGANGTMIIDGPARVNYRGGNIASLTMNNSGASVDFRDNRQAVTISTLNWSQGRLLVGDADLTVSSSLPRGTLSASYP